MDFPFKRIRVFLLNIHRLYAFAARCQISLPFVAIVATFLRLCVLAIREIFCSSKGHGPLNGKTTSPMIPNTILFYIIGSWMNRIDSQIKQQQ